MAFEHKEGKGTFRKNKYKKLDSHPDITGDGMYKGEIVKIAAWQKKDKDGGIYYSFSIAPKGDAQGERKPQREVDEDQIPF
jgi:hypothetical protein